MAKIKIIDVPLGFAPLYIREQWVGIEMPLTSNPIPKGKEIIRIGNDNEGGYQVDCGDAIKALIAAGKQDAADFWYPYSDWKLTFKKDKCELIS